MTMHFSQTDLGVASPFDGVRGAGRRRARSAGGTVVLIFGDQLTMENPVFENARPAEDMILLVEDASRDVAAPRARLRRRRAFEAFAEDLRRRRWRVEIIAFSTAAPGETLANAVKTVAARSEFAAFSTAEPGDVATRDQLEALVERFRKPLSILRDPRFLCSRWDFADILRSSDGPQAFYRAMRAREDLLMDGDRPEGGRWRHIDGDPWPRAVSANEEETAFGKPPPTRRQAEVELERFIATTLPRLGACEYLDPSRPHPFPCAEVEAMLDLGLIGPRAICKRIERAYRDGHAPLHAAEHAIYRLIGVREHQRGLARIGGVSGGGGEA